MLYEVITDTGYDWDHPALQQQYRGWNGVTVTHEYNWHDAIHTSVGICGADSLEPCDDNGHGTHTMGTRITSYNVCYTKLLRYADIRQCQQGEGAEHIDQRRVFNAELRAPTAQIG